MRVFVTGTGRCGTVTFSRACRHIANYTSGHETHAGRIGDVEYPDNHIEVDPHLIYVIGRLLDRYPSAFWVHLTRERAATIRSIARRPSVRHSAMFHFQAVPDGPRAAAALYDETHALIRRLLPTALTLRIEELADVGWARFWAAIGADGDCAAAKSECSKRYNASTPPPAEYMI